jgi:hypothetical protein
MAITVHQEPDEYTPGYNDQVYVLTSTQIGNADFQYKAVCTDDDTNSTITYSPPKYPVTGQGIFDAKIFSKKYIKHYIPNNQYGWQVCTDALRKIDIEFREYYGGNTVAASPPLVDSFYVWNGVLRTKDWTSYDRDNFIYTNNNSSPSVYNHKPLNKFINMKTFEDKSLFLYFMCDTTPIGGINIDTYDSDNNLIGSSVISNPFAIPADFTEQYVCIDIGHKGLSQISSGLVTGAYPIITPAVKSYNITDTSFINQTLFAIVNLECEPTYDVYPVHYLANNGNFETVYFNKASVLSERAEKTYYRQNPYKLVGNTYTYSNFTPHERVLASAGQEALQLNTDWLTEAEIAVHRELYTSSVVYIDFGTELIPYKVIDSQVEVSKDFNKKLKGWTVTLEPTYKNRYQNG